MYEEKKKKHETQCIVILLIVGLSNRDTFTIYTWNMRKETSVLGNILLLLPLLLQELILFLTPLHEAT